MCHLSKTIRQTTDRRAFGQSAQVKDFGGEYAVYMMANAPYKARYMGPKACRTLAKPAFSAPYPRPKP
jgi:hypothetical protein